jgi:hypothetical protein
MLVVTVFVDQILVEDGMVEVPVKQLILQQMDHAAAAALRILEYLEQP